MSASTTEFPVNLQKSILTQGLFSLLCCRRLHFCNGINGGIPCDGYVGTRIIDVSVELKFIGFWDVLRNFSTTVTNEEVEEGKELPLSFSPCPSSIGY